MRRQETATVVMVHGAFHGGWCWSYVVDGLRQRGVPAVAVDLPGHGESPDPLGGLAEHSAALRAILRERAAEGPVILCAHSYGGVVASEAAESDTTRELVFVAALVPDEGESAGDAMPELHSAPILQSVLPQQDGSLRIDPAHAAALFYHDCEEVLADWAVERLGPQRPETLLTAISRAAWRELDSTYLVCQQDRTLPPEAERRLAKRCTRSLELDCAHSPMLSQPQRLIEVLTARARG